MSNRDSLHRLVDTLPEAALESAERVLQNYQTWRPQPPADVQKLHEQVKERFERSAREHAARTGMAVVRSSFGLSSFRPDGDGAASMTGMEGETSVKVELRVFRGLKLELEERLRLSDDKSLLLYYQRIKGPTGKEDSYEVEYDVRKCQ